MRAQEGRRALKSNLLSVNQRRRDMAQFLSQLPPQQILLLLLGYVEKWPGISAPGEVMQEMVDLPPLANADSAVSHCRSRLLDGGVLDSPAFQKLHTGQLDLSAELAVNICSCLLDPFEVIPDADTEADGETLEFNQQEYQKAQLRSAALLVQFLGPAGEQILNYCPPRMTGALGEAKTWAQTQTGPEALRQILAALENCFHTGLLDYQKARLLLLGNPPPQSLIWGQLAKGLAIITGHAP